MIANDVRRSYQRLAGRRRPAAGGLLGNLLAWRIVSSKILRILVPAVLLLAITALPAAAQTTEPADCGTYLGVVCQGWFTDDAGVVDDDARVTAAIDALVGEYGHQIAFVIVDATPQGEPLEFAQDLGNAWGVGMADGPAGIVILIDLANRRTEVTTGPGLSLPESRIAGAGDSFFGRGDFEGGALAIIGSLEQELEEPGTSSGGPSGSLILGVLGIAALAGGGTGLYAARRRKQKRIRTARAELIDGDVTRLEPAGHELPARDDYALPFTGKATTIPTTAAVTTLRAIDGGDSVSDLDALHAVWSQSLISVIDPERLRADTAVPLELRSSSERPLLEGALQNSIEEVLDVDDGDERLFEVKRQELNRIIDSLRPHRVAAARFRLGRAIEDRLTETAVGHADLTDVGERFLRAAPALDGSSPLATSAQELDAVYSTAQAKTDRLHALYSTLPDSTARPAVAAALADLGDDPSTAFSRYELVRAELAEKGASLTQDGLSIPAVAALLLMNHDEEDLDDFLAAYESNRDQVLEPAEAIEYALAGLREPGEIKRIRSEARRLGLPVSITTALLRRRDDGPQVYLALADELAKEGLTGDTRKTIAGILAVSLEPAQAMRRWLDARQALAALGLQGAYADVAAAFGASDPRGPRTFALAYAAQRQALARSDIADADRFAPELAHEGTSNQTDTWSGQPIPSGLRDFDPFTLFFYHWVITDGQRGSYGWEPVYRDHSWSADHGSWWGGGGGFSGGGGSSWGGSSWGGSSSGGGSFGGSFGGGGGFSGGGGSSW